MVWNFRTCIQMHALRGIFPHHALVQRQKCQQMLARHIELVQRWSLSSVKVCRPTQAKQQRQKELAAPRPPRVEIFIFKFHPGGYFLI